MKLHFATMDCIFEKCFLPKSSSSLIIINPVSKTFINGLAKKYSDEYPTQLKDVLEKELFFKCISEINILLATFWPCFPAFLFGYFCSVCTLGCSFLIPFLCVNDAEKMLKNLIEQQNREIFKPRGLEMRFMKKCSTSWIQIKIKSEIELQEKQIKTEDEISQLL